MKAELMICLMQHGEARPAEEDADRPLTDRGRAASRAAGELLARRGVRIDRILHSGKTRARQTAVIVAAALGNTSPVAEASDLGPDADPQVWRERLGDVSDEVLLVGHMSHLARLAGALMCDDGARMPIVFRPGTVAILMRADGAAGWAVSELLVPDTGG